MSELLSVTVPGRPIPQGRMRFTKSGHGYHHKASAEYRDALAMFFRAAWRGKAPIARPVAVSIGVAGANQQSDLDNHAKQVLDALTTAGVLSDDCLKVVERLSCARVEGEARVVVTISEAVEESPTPR